MDETKYAYLAGLFDGEGSVSISKAKAKSRRKYAINAYIGVSNTDARALEAFQECFPKLHGSVYVTQPKIEGFHNEVRVLIYRRQVEIKEVLERLLPYLRLKKERATLMIEYCKNRLDRKIPHGQGAVYTSKDLELYDAIKHSIHSYHQLRPQGFKGKID